MTPLRARTFEPLGHHDATEVAVLKVRMHGDDVDLAETVRV